MRVFISEINGARNSVIVACMSARRSMKRQHREGDTCVPAWNLYTTEPYKGSTVGVSVREKEKEREGQSDEEHARERVKGEGSEKRWGKKARRREEEEEYSPIFDSTGHGTVRTCGKYLLQQRKTGIPVRERALLTDPTWCVRRRSPLVRPRNIRFVLCAIAERIRSLHDLPLLDPARSLIRIVQAVIKSRTSRFNDISELDSHLIYLWKLHKMERS
ncbi:hypothetical protein ALC60_06811 [Trachymyrmex zeteki]|uniref:Uncharacterized protein n=1 Tax=Mycetomoellerius zeteki TaxID=64791 RepID=A0A151X1J2_9HYME|nr:hypothetical protein ALC60_06811 [Trachymyrmex zeteki]